MIDQSSKDLSLLGRLGSIWGVVGVSLLLSFAVYRLSIIAIDAFSYDFEWYHLLVFIGNSLFMAHSEGYKGFQKGFSPRVAARARYILNNPRLLHVVTAPFFCMGYFYTTRRRLIVAYGMTLGIIALVVLFNQISQPWRGILDAGVVVGLSWGIASLVWFAFEAMGTGEFGVSAELPIDDM